MQLKIKRLYRIFTLFFIFVAFIYPVELIAQCPESKECADQTCQLRKQIRKRGKEEQSVEKEKIKSVAPSTSSEKTESRGDDEFKPIGKSEVISKSKSSEKSSDTAGTSSAGDEFDEFKPLDESQSVKADETANLLQGEHQGVVLWVLFFTIIAGILVRFKATRNLRSLFLIGFLIYLGFYRGGCPCPISSIQDVFLWLIGSGGNRWQSMLWFLGLIPITYVFGKVWCGWICHLGAFQEFLFIHDKFKFLRGERAQLIMKIIRYALILALVVQLLITQTNWFCKIDPFKVAFNFTSYYTIGWVLLGLLLLSSLFIYRPFCKAACPIGLVLGLVSKIPGASVIGEDGKCNGCRLCNSSCDMDAIVRKEKYSVLDNKECIVCGECIDSCKNDAMSFFRKGKKHNDKIVFRREDSDTSD